MIFLLKPVDFIKSISSRKYLSSVSIALAKGKKLEMVNVIIITSFSFGLKSEQKLNIDPQAIDVVSQNCYPKELIFKL